MLQQAQNTESPVNPTQLNSDYGVTLENGEGLLKYYGIFRFKTNEKKAEDMRRELDPLLPGSDWEDATESQNKNQFADRGSEVKAIASDGKKKSLKDIIK